ncbi:MAG: histidine kinase dimerization/phospho-acceptor domain-containing protein, partial [Methermicoccaceae archaeon]
DQLETNIEIFATLVDGIRNPLAVIAGYAELARDERGRKTLNQCERINKIIKQFDEGWLESEKVRDFLRRHV